jgi:hypothetical protein
VGNLGRSLEKGKTIFGLTETNDLKLNDKRGNKNAKETQYDSARA